MDNPTAPSLPSAPEAWAVYDGTGRLNRVEWIGNARKYAEDWAERLTKSPNIGYAGQHYTVPLFRSAPLPSALSAADREWLTQQVEVLATTSRIALNAGVEAAAEFQVELAARYRRILSACTAERELVLEEAAQVVRDMGRKEPDGLISAITAEIDICALKSKAPSLAPEGETL